MRRLVGVALMVAFCASACGTTQIISNEPGARIWVDGRLIGRGQAEIGQRGTPGSATVLVKAEDGRQQRTVVSREFTGLTLLAGLFTYGICLFACWEYPDTVFVALPPLAPAANATPASWTGGVDPWLQPPPGWQPKTPAP